MSSGRDAQGREQLRDGGGEDAHKGRGRHKGRERTHDPIIIDGGSFDFEFDGVGEMNYHALTSGRYVGANLRIGYVTVEDKARPHDRPHRCPLPASGLCVIKVHSELNGRPETDEPFSVSAVAGVVAVEFNDSVYGTPASSGHRKRAGHPHRRLTGLTISGPGFNHTCPAIPKNGKCVVTIRDRHLIELRTPLCESGAEEEDDDRSEAPR